ncbi:MAG: hypothetical protein RBT41_05055 [Clostridia bacterium]|jgi:hypothetical protein|nr:hypothetical protein [Clostridia bacterium]
MSKKFWARLSAVLLIVAVGVGWAWLRANENEPGFSGISQGAEMTLDDVRVLSHKGDQLTFEDFKGFKGANVSSNLNYLIMVYALESKYRLIVSTDGKIIDGANLESIHAEGGSGIDIRYEDADEFLNTGTISG